MVRVVLQVNWERRRLRDNGLFGRFLFCLGIHRPVILKNLHGFNLDDLVTRLGRGILGERLTRENGEVGIPFFGNLGGLDGCNGLYFCLAIAFAGGAKLGFGEAARGPSTTSATPAATTPTAPVPTVTAYFAIWSCFNGFHFQGRRLDCSGLGTPNRQSLSYYFDVIGSRNGKLGGRSAFERNSLRCDLFQLEHLIFHAGDDLVIFLVVFEEIRNIEERISLQADVDEGGLHSRKDAGNLPLMNAAGE